MNGLRNWPSALALGSLHLAASALLMMLAGCGKDPSGSRAPDGGAAGRPGSEAASAGAIWQRLTSCAPDSGRKAALQLLEAPPSSLRTPTYRVVEELSDTIECEGISFVLDSTTTRCLRDAVTAALGGLDPLSRVEIALRLDDLAQGMRMAGILVERDDPLPPDLMFKGLVVRKFAIEQLEQVLKQLPDSEAREAREELVARKTAIEAAADPGTWRDPGTG